MAMVLELGLAGPLSGEGILLVILPGFSPTSPPSRPAIPCHRLTLPKPACHTLDVRTTTGTKACI